jgi:hypothetical protein
MRLPSPLPMSTIEITSASQRPTNSRTSLLKAYENTGLSKGAVT